MPKLSLKSMSVADLVALRDKVQAELSRKIEVERLALEKQIAALSELEGGQAVATVADKAPRRRPRKTNAAKSSKRKPAKRRATARYQGPNGENWSGFGRAPRWLTDLEAAGKSRESFRVAE
jgi:DNA-binding protein H-NS